MTFVPQSSPQWSSLPASLCLSLALAGSLFAQAPVRLAQDTPLLKEPGGIRIGTLTSGARVRPGRASGGYVEVSLQGWIFSSSTRPDKREGFDLSVAPTTGENIRAAPDGAVLARAVSGALFNRVGSRAGWTEVRRTGWVQRSRVLAQTPPPKRAALPAATPESAAVPVSALPVAQGEAQRARLRAGATLQRTPDGAAIAVLGGPAEASIEQRNGDWVKVRVDGWVKRIDIEGALAPPPAITAAMLRENPDRYLGQTVEWRVQFLAHQEADELRPEMPLRHPYLLVRGPLPESGFVYVLITREQATQLAGLKPLDELALTATVRAARTRYLATPVVELVRVAAGK